MSNLNSLPKFKDRISFIYLEHVIITKNNNGVVFYNKDEQNSPIPIANLALLMIGPGVSISSAAIQEIGDSGCLTVWCGEHGTKYYASGNGYTSSSKNIMKQMDLFFDQKKREETARKMFRYRFGENENIDGLTINELRGKEGIRIKNSYKDIAKKFNVNWKCRSYDPLNMNYGDASNLCLSTANNCLYGICHSAILSLGYSTAIGFIHEGHQTSFVFDIADLYKVEVSIPIAFSCVSEDNNKSMNNTRIKMRDYFNDNKFLKRVVNDIEDILS